MVPQKDLVQYIYGAVFVDIADNRVVAFQGDVHKDVIRDQNPVPEVPNWPK